MSLKCYNSGRKNEEEKKLKSQVSFSLKFWYPAAREYLLMSYEVFISMEMRKLFYDLEHYRKHSPLKPAFKKIFDLKTMSYCSVHLAA